MTSPSDPIGRIEQELGTSSSELARHQQQLDHLRARVEALQSADHDPAEMLRVQMKLQQIALQEVLCLVLRDFENPALEGSLDPLGDLNAFHFMIAGPPPMAKSVEGSLLEAGLSEDQVQSDSFSGY